MLRSSFRKSTLNKKCDEKLKLDECNRILKPFFNRINLKFTHFPVAWPLKLLGENKSEQKTAIETFLKRFNLTNDLVSNETIMKYLRSDLVINDDAFHNLSQLNRKFKNFKLDEMLVEQLLDNRNESSVEAKNLETFMDALELLTIEDHVTNEFLSCYLRCQLIVNIKNVLLVVKIAEKKRVAKELFKKFGSAQEILFTDEFFSIDSNRNFIEIINQSNYLKNNNNDPFYDFNLSRHDYKFIFNLILNEKLPKGRLKAVINELKFAQLTTNDLHKSTFSYLIQQPVLKIHEGNLKKIKDYFKGETIDALKPDLLVTLMQLDEKKLNIRRILNCEKNSYFNSGAVEQ